MFHSGSSEASESTVADPGGGGAVGARPSFQKKIKNEDLFLNNFVVKNVFGQYLYTI